SGAHGWPVPVETAGEALDCRALPSRHRASMALTSAVVKAELEVSDMDRHYYATHNLTLAQHPSETDTRLMVRLVAFALYADEKLEFGRGLSDEDEPEIGRAHV